MERRLRIVGGTDYIAPAPEVPTPALRPAAKAAPARAKAPPKPITAELIAEAHAAVLACVLPDGLTVEASLRWLQGGFDVFDDDVQCEMSLLLMYVGIADNPTPEVGYDDLGYITQPKKLLTAYPHLRKYKHALAEHPGLPV